MNKSPSPPIAKHSVMFTPKGRAVYPCLNTPSTKFHPEGEFSTGVLLTAEEAKPLKAAYDKALSEYHALVCADAKKQIKLASTSPFKAEVREDGTETGNIIVKFKSKASYKSKDTGAVVQKRIQLVDSQKKPTNAEIWGGSEIRVAYNYNGWCTPALGVGISLVPRSVQVITLRTRGDGIDNTSGFGAEDDGFVSAAEVTRVVGLIDAAGITVEGIQNGEQVAPTVQASKSGDF